MLRYFRAEPNDLFYSVPTENKLYARLAREFSRANDGAIPTGYLGMQDPNKTLSQGALTRMMPSHVVGKPIREVIDLLGWVLTLLDRIRSYATASSNTLGR
jgi:hypothetical protein